MRTVPGLLTLLPWLVLLCVTPTGTHALSSMDSWRRSLTDSFNDMTDSILNALFPGAQSAPGQGSDPSKPSLSEKTKNTLKLAAQFYQQLDEARKPLFKQFVGFVARNNKGYPSLEAVRRRFDNYMVSMTRVDRLKSLASGGLFGVTKFSDMSPAEFLQKSTGLRQTAGFVSALQNITSVLFSEEGPRHKRDAVPEEWDWDAQGKVTPPKDQGQCGSCYTFGSIGAIETQILINQGCKTDLSEQQLVDCSHEVTHNNKCDGGTIPETLDYIAKNGVAKEKDYPYISAESSQAGQCNKNVKMYKKVSGYKLVENTEDALQEAIYRYGAVPTAVDVTELQDYKGGIASFPIKKWQVNHLVLAVGYGVENGKKFWKVKNSWGADWGEKGFFRLERGSKQLNIATYQYVPVW